MAKLTRILSIDGGGIRGIIPGQLLVAFEEMLQQESGNPMARISHYFDLIAGTSTGGILACAYLCPEKPGKKAPCFTAEEVVGLYFKRGHDIFDIPVFHSIRSVRGLIDEKYPAKGIEKALKDYFGNTKLSELLKPCLITAYDITNTRGHFFTQHDAKKSKSYDFLVRDVARATSAAPTYFECALVKSLTNARYPLVDGGVFVNNPALCAYAEVRNFKSKPKAKDMLILSLGTGYTEKSYQYKKAKDWGALEWLKPVINIMMDGVAETVDYQLGQIYDAANAPNQYLRINPKLPKSVDPDMDNASPENLKALKRLGVRTAKKHEAELRRIARLLVKE
ncbi:MAG: patatin [Flavobacteriales bacterium]|nr:MAG: patatin [Flavobacteriales bacterium]